MDANNFFFLNVGAILHGGDFVMGAILTGVILQWAIWEGTLWSMDNQE